MNVTEATRAQTLIGWLTDPHATTPEQADAARDAAAWLADRAHHTLHAGPTGAAVAAAWPALLQGCYGCPTCAPEPDDQDDNHPAEDAVPARHSARDLAELAAAGYIRPVQPA